MLRTDTLIHGIPAILWGEPSEKIFVAVHGNMSSKDDVVIKMFAEEAARKGYRVLSFDLPEHGARAGEDRACEPRTCTQDLKTIIEYARTLSKEIGVFACSMGAYFSLLAYKDEGLTRGVFLSPVLDMKKLIDAMLFYSGISVERLAEEKEIRAPSGQLFSWSYYSHVQDNPIETWPVPTSILYGSQDNMTAYETVTAFVSRFGAEVRVLDGGGHFFHTDAHLAFYRSWLQEVL